MSLAQASKGRGGPSVNLPSPVNSMLVVYPTHIVQRVSKPRSAVCVRSLLVLGCERESCERSQAGRVGLGPEVNRQITLAETCIGASRPPDHWAIKAGGGRGLSAPHPSSCVCQRYDVTQSEHAQSGAMIGRGRGLGATREWMASSRLMVAPAGHLVEKSPRCQRPRLIWNWNWISYCAHMKAWMACSSWKENTRLPKVEKKPYVKGDKKTSSRYNFSKLSQKS